MTESDLRPMAKDQLGLVLSFFPRVDSKISLLVGIDIAMLAYLASKTPPFSSWEAKLLFALIPVILLSVSLWHLYLASFPQLEGGRDSLVYFREIATRAEGKYLEDFKKQTPEFHVNDLLGQVWRNSQILKEKFHHLKLAFQLLGWAILPWLVTLGTFVATHPSLAPPSP